MINHSNSSEPTGPTDGFQLSAEDLKSGVEGVLAAVDGLDAPQAKTLRFTRRISSRRSRALVPLLAASLVGAFAIYGSLRLMQEQQCQTFACLLEDEIHEVSIDDVLDLEQYQDLWDDALMEAAMELDSFDDLMIEFEQ